MNRFRWDTLYIGRVIYANRQIRKMATKVFHAYNARSTMETSIHTCAIMHVTMAVKQLLSPIPHNRRVGKLQCSRLAQHFRAWLVKEREYVSNLAQLFPGTVSLAVPPLPSEEISLLFREVQSRAKWLQMARIIFYPLLIPERINCVRVASLPGKLL